METNPHPHPIPFTLYPNPIHYTRTLYPILTLTLTNPN